MWAERKDIIYQSGKVYTHSIGLSCCFRQWRAASHCKFLHGYALQVSISFVTDKLDEHGWVMDFGGLKTIKTWLEETFDHKTLVASDDPDIVNFRNFVHRGIIQMVEFPGGVGCEAFARLIFEYVEQWLVDTRDAFENPPRVKLDYVKVEEHASNWAICKRRDGT